MLYVTKKRLKKFYEEEARCTSHQELMYLKGNKHQLWWHRKRLRYIFSFLLEIFRKNQITTFVDVGCAEGFHIKSIASFSKGTFCVGADIARAYIIKARKNSRTLKNVDYVVCDIEKLPFKDNSFDIVLCSEVLEHVHNYHESVTELYRITKKYLVISFPGHSYLYKAIAKIRPIKKLVNNTLLPAVGHISEVNIDEVRGLLKECKSLKIKIGGVLPLRLYKIIPSIKLIEGIDNILCKVMEHFGCFNNVTIHVIKAEKRKIETISHRPYQVF
jgi:ubiquinone/menaquinone biosynthesis C-methylase UbiE